MGPHASSTATAPGLHTSVNLVVLGIAAFGLGLAGVVARSFPFGWSGVVVSAVFVVLGGAAATPLLRSGPRWWCSGYTVVALVFAVAAPWMIISAQVAGPLTLLGVGFFLLGWIERSSAVRHAGLAAIVVGAVFSSELGREVLPLADTSTYGLVPAVATAVFGACAGLWGVGRGTFARPR